MSSDTPIREVVKRALYNVSPRKEVTEGEGARTVPYEEAEPKTDWINGHADAVLTSLAALTDEALDAAFDRYRYECFRAKSTFSNDYMAAERDLRAIAAMRGRGVVVTEEMVESAIAEWYKPGEYTWDNQGPFTETHERMRLALESALAAKEQG